MSIEIEKTFYPITIHVQTNVSPRPITLTKNMFYFSPDKSTNNDDVVKGVKKEIPEKVIEKKETEKKDETSSYSEYPFYTEEKKYPVSSVKPSTKKFASYFDSELYEKSLGDVDYNVGKEERYVNANYNIMGMLETFFPTSLPNEFNINTSYSATVLNTAIPTVSSNWLPNWLTRYFYNENKKNYSYIVIGGKRYTVFSVLWLNDVMTHPIYKRFFKNILDLEKVKTRTISKLTKDIEILNNIFGKQRQNSNTEMTLSVKDKSIKTLNRMMTYNQSRSIVRQNIYLEPMINAIKKVYVEQKNKASYDEHRASLYTLYLAENDSRESFERILPSDITSSTEFWNLLTLAVKIETKMMILDFIQQPSSYIKFMNDENTKKQYRFVLLKKGLDEIGGYGKLLRQMQRNISSVRSSNPVLQGLVDDFMKGVISSDLLDLATKLSAGDIDKITNLRDALETGVVNTSVSMTQDEKERDKESASKKTEPKYEIYIQLDLLDAVIDSKNIGKVNCSYRNNMLIKKYNGLRTRKVRGGSHL